MTTEHDDRRGAIASQVMRRPGRAIAGVAAPGIHSSVVYVARMRVFLVGISGALALSACPPATGSSGKSNEPVTTCATAGQSCVFQEGKLGLCVERTGPCNGSGCLVCQSLH
jgi:hypothetical protein